MKDARNLILGNGDLFLADTVDMLPSLAAYKESLAGGTLAILAGNLGAIKGTVSVQITREMLAFELGLPQEIGDISCIREGVHIKCSLAELSLANIKAQIGGGVYAHANAGATLVAGEAFTPTFFLGDPVANPVRNGPLLLTTSTPAATKDPVVYSTASRVTATNSPAAGATVDINMVATAGFANTNVVKVTSADGKTVEYATITSVTTDTKITVATLVNNYVTPFVYKPLVHDEDYVLDLVTNTVTPLNAGLLDTNVHAGALGTIRYYYGALASETLTGGGQASVLQTAARFFHPYKDGRVLMFTLLRGSPVGTITLPFEEVAYSHAEFELRGISDFTQVAGGHLYRIYRDLAA